MVIQRKAFQLFLTASDGHNAEGNFAFMACVFMVDYHLLFPHCKTRDWVVKQEKSKLDAHAVS
jgi:hypothetical protein